MFGLPTWAWPFLFAVIAAVAARVLVGPEQREARSPARMVLYAVAIACVVLGFVYMWLSQH